jgi:hypothetical protein
MRETKFSKKLAMILDSSANMGTERKRAMGFTHFRMSFMSF